MKTALIIIFLIALLISVAVEVHATLCIEDVVTGEIWCEPEPPLSPVALPVQWVYLPLVLR